MSNISPYRPPVYPLPHEETDVFEVSEKERTVADPARSGGALVYLECSLGGAQPAVNPEATPLAGTGAQSPPHNREATSPETYQGTPVGFMADAQPFRGNPHAPLTLAE
jgi:hypothetical protein